MISFPEFSFHISPEKNIFPRSQKIPRLIWVLFKFLLKIVIIGLVSESSVIADHFTITHKIFDLQSLTLMIAETGSKSIYDHS